VPLPTVLARTRSIRPPVGRHTDDTNTMKSNRRDILKTLGVLSAIGSTGVSLSEPVAAADSIAYEPEQKRDLFVDPDEGNDDWSGQFIEPRGKARGEQEGSGKNSGKGQGAGNDGPLETIQEAIDRARQRALGDSYGNDFVNVWLLGGRYELDEPITIEP